MDSVLIFASLGAFKDKDGLHLPDFGFLKREIPRQNRLAEEIAIVGTAGATSSAAAATVMGLSFFINLLFTGSMNSLWSALNAVQIIVYLPMFERLKFPNNASEMNRRLIKVAGFDLVNTGEWVDPHIIDLGDEGSPFSYSLEECGYETKWLLGNSSFIVWILVLNAVAFLIYLLMSLLSYKTGRCASLTSKLKRYFVFNGPLRLFMETFLDLYLSFSLNVLTADN